MDSKSWPELSEKVRREYLRRILLARLYDLVRVTHLQKLEGLSARLGSEVLLKREDEQPIHSFKLRGAYNKIKQLDAQQLRSGVITASAGNHAQGVALSARQRGARAVIVMPTTTPDLKVNAVRHLGAEVVMHGASFDESYEYARTQARAQGLIMVPPFDDPDVIAGQGTIAQELAGQCDHIEAVFVQIGGGGLAAGVAAYIKALLPQIRVIGVEAEGSACMQAALRAGHPVDIGAVSHFADGVAVSCAGSETYQVLRDNLDDLITCSNDEICAAMKDIFDDTRAIAEPSGALGLAGLKRYARSHANVSGGALVAILSGANVRFHTLRLVAERCDVGEMTEGIVSVEIPEAKGAFLSFCHAIGERPVTEFSYRLSDDKKARIFASIELTKGRTELDEVIAGLRERGYAVDDLSGDAIAKDHVRYMIGGHPLKPIRERLFHFEFPATGRALTGFLETLGDSYSISLFHFRITGLEFCSVLCGFDVTGREEGLMDFIRQVGYPCQEVSDNLTYRQFLR